MSGSALIQGLFHRQRDYLVFIRFGGDLLSHVLRRSTIGATVLNGRVRDGIGCFTRAMTTKPNKYQIPSQVSVYAFDVISKERYRFAT